MYQQYDSSSSVFEKERVKAAAVHVWGKNVGVGRRACQWIDPALRREGDKAR